MLQQGAGWGETTFEEAEKADAKDHLELAWATCDEDDVEACLAALNVHLDAVVSFFHGQLE